MNPLFIMHDHLSYVVMIIISTQQLTTTSRGKLNRNRSLTHLNIPVSLIVKPPNIIPLFSGSELIQK